VLFSKWSDERILDRDGESMGYRGEEYGKGEVAEENQSYAKGG